MFIISTHDVVTLLFSSDSRVYSIWWYTTILFDLYKIL